MLDNLKYKSTIRLYRYVCFINYQGVFKVDYSSSNEHINLTLFSENEKYENSILNIDKLSDEVLIEKVNEICKDLEKYRNIEQ